MTEITNGSPKQVAWAERIKSEYSSGLSQLAAVGDTDSAEDRRGRSLIKALHLSPKTSPAELADVTAWFVTQNDAVWLIDRANAGIEGLIALHRGRPQDCLYPF